MEQYPPMTDDFTIENNSRLSVPQHVLARTVGDETVLLNLASEQYFGLDGVGSRLWELFEAGVNFAEAISTLTNEYDVDRETLTVDMRAIVSDLVSRGLLEQMPPS